MTTESSDSKDNNVTSQFVENILSQENQVSVTSSSNEAQISPATTNLLVSAFSKKTGLNFQQSFIGICIICQKGGTAKRAQGEIYAIVDGKKSNTSND